MEVVRRPIASSALVAATIIDVFVACSLLLLPDDCCSDGAPNTDPSATATSKTAPKEELEEIEDVMIESAAVEAWEVSCPASDVKATALAAHERITVGSLASCNVVNRNNCVIRTCLIFCCDVKVASSVEQMAPCQP